MISPRSKANKHQKYHDALRALISIKRHLNIVLVGANDGKINDPIYDFVQRHAQATRILLVEPMTPIIPYLQKNYAYHPAHQIANCAIGEGEELTMYAVKPEYWQYFKPAYAKGWPAYRAASGITSAVRSHLEKCLARQNIDANAAIEQLKTPCYSLQELLKTEQWPQPIDVLQVDAEGYDNVVIYNADIEQTLPKMIFFESHNMADDHSDPLSNYLIQHGYRIHRVGGNSLAIRKGLRLWNLWVNVALRVLAS